MPGSTPSSNTPQLVQIELPRAPEAGARARRFVEAHLRAHMSSEALANARLVVSELVNNALVHGDGRIVLKAQLREDAVHVEVVDEGSGNAPAIREQGRGDSGGWGLRIVDAVARRWGAHEGTTHVWVELPAR